jgi:hypothetical protein
VPDPLEAAVGLLLLFFLPGFALTRALYPERRVLRPLSLLRLVEQLTLGIVLSVALGILVGFVWLGTPGGVQAGWSEPLVELTLAGIAAAAFAVAFARGSFARVPPAGPALEAQGGLSDPTTLLHELEGLHREERRIRHRLRVAGAKGRAAGDDAQELERVRQEIRRIESGREAEYRDG